MCSVLDETTWWNKSAGNHYETGKKDVARVVKKIMEILEGNTLALGSRKEENTKKYFFTNLSSGAN